jgi:hypothetical protein
MLENRNLVVDTFSEVYNLMKPWMTHDFWDFANHEIIGNSVYIISRKQFFEYPEKIRTLLERDDLIVFFDNAAEGSWTLISQLQALGLKELALNKKLFLIGGGDIESSYVHVQFEHFLSSILRYEENSQATKHIDNIFKKTDKPYKFLFLNGRARPHRKYLFERFKEEELLDCAIWTMLDSRPSISRSFKLEKDGINLMATVSPLKWLPEEYEYQTYRGNEIVPGPPERTFIKHELFKNEWGEIYLEPAPYIDTYFSLVTETVFEYPYSFRTEKIAKPLAIGHPFIVAANTGFYRDLRNLGFRTFDNVIDESFDTIENHQDRMNRIFEIVKDLCRQDLQSFLAECFNICKYNQQHLIELIPQLQQQFPEKFFKTINQHG